MKQNQFFPFMLVFLLCGINVNYAFGEEIVNMQHVGIHDDHYKDFKPADEPDVYYDSSSQSIIIDGTGYVSYYDVVIESATSWTVMISTQVNGNYDTIDISSLPAGMYCITIDSPAGNSYEGFFDTY